MGAAFLDCHQLYLWRDQLRRAPPSALSKIASNTLLGMSFVFSPSRRPLWWTNTGSNSSTTTRRRAIRPRISFSAGFDHTFNPHFNVSLRAGVEVRNFDDFGERTSPYGEATLRYAPGDRTSISWTELATGWRSRMCPGRSRAPHFAPDSPRPTGLRRGPPSAAQFSINTTTTTTSCNHRLFVPLFNEDSLDLGLSAALRYQSRSGLCGRAIVIRKSYSDIAAARIRAEPLLPGSERVTF